MYAPQPVDAEVVFLADSPPYKAGDVVSGKIAGMPLFDNGDGCFTPSDTEIKIWRYTYPGDDLTIGDEIWRRVSPLDALAAQAE